MSTNSVLQNNSFAALRTLRSTAKRKPLLESSPDSSNPYDPRKDPIEPPIQVDKRPRIDDKGRLGHTLVNSILRSTFQPDVSNTVVSADRQAMILVMNPEDIIYIQGQARLVVIQGSVIIYGHTLHGQGLIKDELWTSYSCFAPHGMPALSILALGDALKTCPYEGQGTLISEVERVSLRELAQTLNKRTQKNSILLGLLSSCKNGARGFESVSPNFKGLFPKALSAERESLPGLQFVGTSEASAPEISFLQIPTSWTSGVDCLSETKEQPNLVVCVLGAKNSGKSTCMRYTVNRLLNKYPKIAYLDCDIGQTEFTPPGLVSLSIIESPLFGPAFTHLVQPDTSFFIGATSPKHDPDYYLACIMELWQKFKSSASAGVPLVVNTQGWIKGMGYDLLSVFLAHIQPSHILHISSTDGRTPIFNSIFSKLTTSQVINIDSAANLQYRPKFHASDYRTLSLVSYFMQSNLPLHQRRKEWDFSIPIASQTPYRVPWACVHIQFQAHEIPPSQMLYGLNGSIVALVSDKTQYTKQEGSTPFNDLSLIPSQTSLAPSRHNCVGLGIIRSIDITTGDFLLLTPVEPHLLSSVNLLIKGLGHGGIDVPVSLQMQGFQTTRFSMESQVPYTTFFLTEGIGALAKKTRALQRKRDFQ